MTQCIKTGAHVRLNSHTEWLYGDVFRTSQGTLLMRVCDRRREPLLDVKHFTFMSYDVWFDENETSSNRNSTLVAEGFIDHGYEGISI